jgi:hypothetical protein
MPDRRRAIEWKRSPSFSSLIPAAPGFFSDARPAAFSHFTSFAGKFARQSYCLRRVPLISEKVRESSPSSITNHK